VNPCRREKEGGLFELDDRGPLRNPVALQKLEDIIESEIGRQMSSSERRGIERRPQAGLVEGGALQNLPPLHISQRAKRGKWNYTE